MKIALCLYGQPRFIDNELGHLSHKNHIFSQGQVDVFAHYWFDREKDIFETSDWSSHHNNYIHPESDKLIQEFYSPKSFLEEKPKTQFDFEDTIDIAARLQFFTVNNFYNLRSHLYSFEKSLSLVKESNEEYDFVISSRYDNYIYSFPNLKELSKERIYIDSRCNGNFTDAILLFGFNLLQFFTPYSNFREVINKVPLLTSEEFKKHSFLLHKDEGFFSHLFDLHAQLLRSKTDTVGQW